MSITPRNRTDIRISDLFEVLNTSIIRAINLLKSRFNGDMNRQIYATIIDDQIKNGLNSGNYSMQSPAEAISNHLLNMLNSYLQSNESSLINDSFCIQFKVLSVAHIEHKKQFSKTFVPHTVGHKKHDNTNYPSYFLNFPKFCAYHATNCFPDLCLIFCSLFGMLKLECEELSNYFLIQNFRRDIVHRYKSHRDQAAMVTHTKLVQYIEKGGKITGSISDFATQDLFTDYQIHTFDSEHNFSYIESHPPQFSFEKKPIYLCLEERSHVILILNYALFCSSKIFFIAFIAPNTLLTSETFDICALSKKFVLLVVVHSRK